MTKKIIISLFLLLLFSTSLLFAGKPESSDTYRRNVINKYITLSLIRKMEKAIEREEPGCLDTLEKLNSFDGQTIFWAARVYSFGKKKGWTYLILKMAEKDYITIWAPGKVRNIDVDRTGYRVAVKGRVVLKDGRFYYIRALSVVILAPPLNSGFRGFAKEKGLANRFQFEDGGAVATLESDYYPFLIYWMSHYNPSLDDRTRNMIAESIVYYSYLYDIDPVLMTSLFCVESALIPDIVSPAGAVGLGQLMPSTAYGLGVDPYNPRQNIEASTRHFRDLLDRWKGCDDQIPYALASYNAGAGAVEYYGGIPPYSETSNYVYIIQFLQREIEKQLP